MKTVMLLLVVGMLLSPSFARPPHHKTEHNLNHIIDLAKHYKKSLTKEIFVEDVSDLTEGSDRCGNKFFCKVHEILENHANKPRHPHKNDTETALLKNLSIYINSTNVDCTKTLAQVTPSEQTKPLPVLVGLLSDCCKHKNLNAA